MQGRDPLSATVVIPSFRRSEIVLRAVEVLLPQLGEQDRCIVVVQGDAGEREDTIKAIARRGQEVGWEFGDKRSLNIIEQPKPGRSAARNLGLLESGTPFVAYIDDDSMVRPGWLEALLRPLEEDRADVVTGRIVEKPDRTTNDPQRVGAVLTWTGHTRRNFNTDRSGSSGIASSGNMAVRRGLALRAGGFDTRFDEPAVYEDVEFSERLRRMGARIWYAADAVIDHLAIPSSVGEESPESSEVERAGHMSLIFRLHRPLLWPVMAKVYLAAAAWKAVRGRLPLAIVPRVAAALLRGWRRGSDSLPPLLEGIDSV